MHVEEFHRKTQADQDDRTSMIVALYLLGMMLMTLLLAGAFLLALTLPIA